MAEKNGFKIEKSDRETESYLSLFFISCTMPQAQFWCYFMRRFVYGAGKIADYKNRKKVKLDESISY